MLTKIKNKLLVTEPFFGYLLLKLKFIKDEDVGTMAVDGVSFWYSPSFVERTSPVLLLGIVVHELLHCVLLQCTVLFAICDLRTRRNARRVWRVWHGG